MNTRNLKQTFVICLAIAIPLTIGTGLVPAQNKGDRQSSDLLATVSGNSLEGTWQSVVTPRDCQSGAPAPFTFKALTTFMAGGAMSEDALDAASPYRTGGHGIWKRTSGRQYATAWIFYTFAPNGTFTGSVTVKVNKTLSDDFNSLTGD